MTTLDDIFPAITQSMTDSMAFSAYDDYGTVCFCFDGYGYIIRGSGYITGKWREYGDGRSAPKEYALTSFKASIDNLTVLHVNEVTGDEIPVPDIAIKHLWYRLEDTLIKHIKNSYN